MKQSELESLRRQFPVGARVILEKMDDEYAPPIGTKGTVVGVDDIGSITQGRWHCIKVTAPGSKISILVESEGYDYARYTSVINN